MINLTRNLAASWAGRGVRVNALCPGWFPSEITAPFFGFPDFWERVKAMSPMGRPGIEGELDGAIVFLASDASSFMTGTTLTIDGGTSCTIGAVDYSPEMYATMEQVAGEYGTAIRPS